MILSVLAIGGTMLGATTIAGLLMTYQIRSTSDATNSAKAIFAADAGIDWGTYLHIKPASADPAPVFSNGAEVTVTCFTTSYVPTDCRATSTGIIRSVGRVNNSYRAFEILL